VRRVVHRASRIALVPDPADIAVALEMIKRDAFSSQRSCGDEPGRSRADDAVAVCRDRHVYSLPGRREQWRRFGLRQVLLSAGADAGALDGLRGLRYELPVPCSKRLSGSGAGAVIPR